MAKLTNDSLLNKAVQEMLDNMEAGLRDILNHVEEIPRPFDFEVYDFNTDTKNYEGVINCPHNVQYFFEYDPKEDMISYAKIKEPMYLKDFLSARKNDESKHPLFQLILYFFLFVFWSYVLALVLQGLSDLLT